MPLDGAPPVLRGRIAVYGGVYGNRDALFALRRALADEPPPLTVVFTGDVAAYCAEGEECARDLRGEFAPDIAIGGNCERALAADEDDCGCGFSPDSRCALLAQNWHAHARRAVSAESKQWMGALPPVARFVFGGAVFAVVHAAAESDSRFIFESTAAAEKRAQFDALECDAVIAGHCGLPFTQIVDGRLWHNSGALGMPANDGTARVWFSILREAAGGIEIEHRAIAYDCAPQQQKMRAARLPDGYINALATGLWPSDDILPAAEKRATGIARKAETVFWSGAPRRAAATPRRAAAT